MSELSDREIDALVAEKVMGEPRPLQVAECDLAPIEGHITSRSWLHVHIYDHGDKCEVVPREFSTDISAAMEVVEKMREQGWNFRMDIWTANMKSQMCQFYTGLGGQGADSANESIPRAICEAALATLSAVGEANVSNI